MQSVYKLICYITPEVHPIPLKNEYEDELRLWFKMQSFEDSIGTGYNDVFGLIEWELTKQLKSGKLET